jgi:Secretion system C-terminal sorting domain/Kelch motif
MTRFSIFCFISIFASCSRLAAQTPPTYTSLASAPERVANHASAAASQGDTTFYYTFCGIDSTKIWSGIHLRAYKYNPQTDKWSKLPPVPDPLGGKIAAAASNVKNKIYLIGGYHVAMDGKEVSSNKTHIFDPVTDQWLPDGAPIPVAIDDQVQVVWRDSLIFVVSGWSNTTSVANVQVYNPSTNTWSIGSSVPSTNLYRTFGAAGAIINDTIFYIGGAGLTNNFPAISRLRKGAINPNNPLNINWSTTVDQPLAKCYRCAVGTYGKSVYWFGGSDVTYNFDGIAYNGTGKVMPQARVIQYDIKTGILTKISDNLPAVMDWRGADLGDGILLAGGLQTAAIVTNWAGMINWAALTPIGEVTQSKLDLYPNPTQNHLFLPENVQSIEVFDVMGRAFSVTFDAQRIDVSALPSGMYMLVARMRDGNVKSGRFVR